MIVRNWFPVILGGLTLGLAVFFFAVLGPVSHSFNTPAETVDSKPPAMSEGEYQGAVKLIMTNYASDKDASSAQNMLLTIDRIPASMKDVHIALVGAFGKLAAGDKEDGEKRLNDAKTTYAWLNM